MLTFLLETSRNYNVLVTNVAKTTRTVLKTLLSAPATVSYSLKKTNFTAVGEEDLIQKLVEKLFNIMNGKLTLIPDCGKK